jgi:hypothetical protein
MRRILLSLAAVSMVAGFVATPSASAQQSVGVSLGGFVPAGADGNDVLVRDQGFLSVRRSRFAGPTVGGEYLVGLGDYFEAGARLGFYQRTVSAADTKYTNANGSNITADLRLRVVPFDATVRVLPFGHHAPIVPYVGGGVGVFAWRYSESGQFVDYTPPVGPNPPTFSATFANSGTAVGAVALGGVRVPIGPLAPGFEVRWQSAKGNLSTDPVTGFSAPKIDLGGLSYLFTFNIRF